VLLDRQRRVVEDRVYRALAVLRTARMLGMDEAMKLLSSVRMGVCLDLVTGVSLSQLNRLTIELQPAHLRVSHPDVETDDDEREARARASRASFGELSL